MTKSLNISFLYLLTYLLTYHLTYLYLLTRSSHNLGKRFRPRAKIVYQMLLNTKTERARSVYQKHVLMLKGYLDIW